MSSVPARHPDSPTVPGLKRSGMPSYNGWHSAAPTGRPAGEARNSEQSMAKDYYKVLGVRRDASQADIQKAYRELARKYHPDLHPDDKTAKKKFQEVQAAFDVLNDPEKRDLYDRYGSSFETMGTGGPRGAGPHTYTWKSGPGGPGGFQFEDIDLSQFFGDRFGGQPGGGFGDIFEQFRQTTPRGRRAAGAKAARGADVEAEIRVPFTTSITGGQGEIAVRRQSGKIETISLKIPPGIADGKKLRLQGQGEPGPGGARPGDLLVAVHVAPHVHFQRRGNNLHLTVPVTLGEAALGAKIDVPTPKGTVTLRVPPGTSSGAKLRVRGHGVPAHGDEPAGDLLAEIQIMLPKDLEDAERETLRKIDQGHPQPDIRANLRW